MKIVARVVVLACVLITGGVAYWYWNVRSVRGSETELMLFGNVDVRQMELAINGQERIAELLVEEGDRVTKGQLLAKLETERLEYAVQRSAAMVAAQQQVVARLEAGSRPEEIAKVRADVEAADSIVRDAERTHERESKLRKTDAASQQEVDDALAAMESAQARAKASQAALDLVIAGPRQEDKDEAKATMKRFEAELGEARHDLEDASLIAPADGIVQTRILEVGDMATPLKPVFTVALVDPVWVRAYVSEPDLGKINEGMKATIMTDSFPGKEYEGWVGFISPTAEFTPKPVETRELRTKLVYQIRVFAKNPEGELRLGMPATVKIPLMQQPPSIAEDRDDSI